MSRLLLANFKTFAYEAISLESGFILVIEGRNDSGFIPVYSAGRAFSGMLRDAGDVVIRFCGGDVIAVLAHPGAKGDARLTNVYPFWVT